tara:strand:+ start:71 stop:652 length:582 start_codon:yes stop_codon:yes gene_type:complete
MTQFDTLEEGLTDLMERMEVDMPQFNDRISDAFYTRCYAGERLLNAARDSSTEHAAWMDMVGNPQEAIRTAHEFDMLCWFLSYEQLAEHFDVPLSWINALSLKAIVDPMKMTWKVMGLTMTQGGFLSESAYAAFLDGVERGLIPKSENISELRNPSYDDMTEENKTKFQAFLDSNDNDSSVHDALKGFDFTLA